MIYNCIENKDFINLSQMLHSLIFKMSLHEKITIYDKLILNSVYYTEKQMQEVCNILYEYKYMF
jgi:hypothetical protein